MNRIMYLSLGFYYLRGLIFEEEDFEIEDDEFESVDEEILISYLNEYYVVNPDRLPSSELF